MQYQFHPEVEQRKPKITTHLQLQAQQCTVGCGDVFWEIKRMMEVPPKKKGDIIFLFNIFLMTIL